MLTCHSKLGGVGDDSGKLFFTAVSLFWSTAALYDLRDIALVQGTHPKRWVIQVVCDWAE